MKSKFNALESELQVSKNIIDNLTKYIKTLERKGHENEQYSRRKCLEISGISSGIGDSARNVNVLIDPSYVDDCYRLKCNDNAPEKVKIRLPKRKDVFYRILEL